MTSVGFLGWLRDGDGEWMETGTENDPFRDLEKWITNSELKGGCSLRIGNSPDL